VNDAAAGEGLDDIALAVLTGMLGGGTRRWSPGLLKHYVPVKDEGELAGILDDLCRRGLAGRDRGGLYFLTDAGRDAIMRAVT